jgi:L,D-peptidoglycan transpeptidase YkuD (ErfK/YbiS/YcfS/YnhG family)
VTLLGTAAVALGGWSPVAAPSAGAPVAGAVSFDRSSALPEPGTVDPGRVRPEVPRGYGTVAARAAAEAQAAAEANAAAAAAAAQAAAATEAAAARATVPAGRGSASAAASPASAAAASSGLPLGVDPGSSDQVVTVVAPSAGSTTATLTAWQRGATGWTAALGPVSARIGSAGVGRASESTTRTPAGTFSLTEAFGRSGNPGTALPYRVVDGDDWWVSDVTSPRYNQYAECAPGACDFSESASENLFAAGSVYDHAVVIDYNRGGTPGAGSAFFLHVSNGAATAGCVAIDAGSLTTLLRWLDPSARPLIAIGVG